ncbi:murein hydrolase activator EnvC family protein [Virgibacillus necropolis]|uniref:Uncharacterized protein n=1 Tax=Virgibacillus necropolis TaxID=163877 RepID=A0A221MAT0_9BACI|nr:peptidoglycan DD-metalloendopeptidase family protein [Virgibacillus necropolis]ASN04739.1 hypothetical protein CFK40_06775 [Virgibacillus necropolis]
MNKIISFVLIAVLITTSTLLSIQSVSASTIEDAKKKMDEIESKKEQVNEKQKDVSHKKEETKEDINTNLTKQEKVTNEIEKINDKLAKTKSSIQEKEQEITDTNKEIEQLKIDIKELKESIKKREKLLKKRLRTIQQNGGDMRYIEVILGSQNFGDFVSRSSAVNTIMDQDKNIMETHMAEKREVEAKKKEVVSKKEALKDQKQELVSLKNQLDDQIAKKEELMAQLEAEHVNLENHKETLESKELDLHDQEAELQQSMKAAEDEIARLQQIALEKARKAKAAREQAAKERAAEQAAKEKAAEQEAVERDTKESEPVQKESSNLQQLAEEPAPSNANFIWPAAGSRVSNYGMRAHPILPISRLHAGVDISGPIGTPIYASISGYAMPVNYASSFGNHVIVAGTIKGTDYTTLYAHMSSTAIGGGRYVEQGEIIGYMGSTGLSTGSHLHFEVHVGTYRGNSSSVNPAQYLN